MNTSLQALRDEMRKLSPEQRLELVDEILCTRDATDPELDRQWVAEAKDR